MLLGGMANMLRFSKKAGGNTMIGKIKKHANCENKSHFAAILRWCEPGWAYITVHDVSDSTWVESLSFLLKDTS